MATSETPAVQPHQVSTSLWTDICAVRILLNNTTKLIVHLGSSVGKYNSNTKFVYVESISTETKVHQFEVLGLINMVARPIEVNMATKLCVVT